LIEVNVAPMSPSDVELVRQAVAAFGAGDQETLFVLMAEDVEFFALRSATEGTFKGHDGLRAFLADNRESFEIFEPLHDDFRDVGDGKVLAFGTIRIRGRGSGVETEVPSAVLVTVRDGRVTYFKDYGDRLAALEAAGLA
jgi:ketosteroid isomerase-like protein